MIAIMIGGTAFKFYPNSALSTILLAVRANLAWITARELRVRPEHSDVGTTFAGIDSRGTYPNLPGEQQVIA